MHNTCLRHNYGYMQHVQFPTRGDNTLDLVLSSSGVLVTPIRNFGSSDHMAMEAEFEHIGNKTPASPVKTEVRCWREVPWGHIKGDLRKDTNAYEKRVFNDVDVAEEELDKVIRRVMNKHVKMVKPAAHKPAPWWTKKCSKSYAWKCKFF